MLSSKVNEIMTTHLTMVPSSQSVLDVIKLMAAEDVGRVVITDRDIPVGIFTENDVLRRVVSGKVDASNIRIKEVMTSPIRAVREETHIVQAFAKMFQGHYRHLLVRGRRGRIVGIVSMRRILKIAVELGQGISDTRTLSDIANSKPVTVDQSCSIDEAIQLMVQNKVGAVVATSAGKTTGIFTERDVLKRVATKELNSRETLLEAVMTAPLITLPQTESVGNALAEMYRRDIRNLPVSDAAGDLIGIVSMPEILQYAKAFDFDEQVRRTWKEVAEYLDADDQYTPG